jgi:hypothetical protein
MTAINTLGNDNSQPDGTLVGESATSKVGFHGVTPVILRAGAAGNQDAVLGTAANSGDAGTDNVIDSLRVLLDEVRLALIAKGVITGADA